MPQVKRCSMIGLPQNSNRSRFEKFAVYFRGHLAAEATGERMDSNDVQCNDCHLREGVALDEGQITVACIVKMPRQIRRRRSVNSASVRANVSCGSM
jgi:cytochrome c